MGIITFPVLDMVLCKWMIPFRSVLLMFSYDWLQFTKHGTEHIEIDEK